MPNLQDDDLNKLLSDLQLDSSNAEGQERLLDLLLDDVEGSPKPLPLKSYEVPDEAISVQPAASDNVDSKIAPAENDESLVNNETDDNKAYPDSDELTDENDIEQTHDALSAPIKIKTRSRQSLLTRIKTFFDPKIWPQDLHVGDPSFSMPKKIYIGYLTNIRKKDLIGYINEWIFDNNCNRSSCYYQTLAWNGGFVFEIQEGGSGHGVLQSVLRSLEAQDEITVPSIDRYIKIAKKFDGFSVYMLNEYEKHEESACVEFTDSMAPFYKRNHGLMIGGVVAATLSVGFLMASWFMVNVVYNKDSVPVYNKSTYEMPSQQINKISDIASRDDAFLKSLTFAAGKWKINLETVEVAPVETIAPGTETIEDQMPAADHTGLPPIEPSAPQARAGADLINLHQDLVRTLAEESR